MEVGKAGTEIACLASRNRILHLLYDRSLHQINRNRLTDYLFSTSVHVRQQHYILLYRVKRVFLPARYGNGVRRLPGTRIDQLNRQLALLPKEQRQLLPAGLQ